MVHLELKMLKIETIKKIIESIVMRDFKGDGGERNIKALQSSWSFIYFICV